MQEKHLLRIFSNAVTIIYINNIQQLQKKKKRKNYKNN